MSWARCSGSAACPRCTAGCDTRLRRDVAVKVLRADLARDPSSTCGSAGRRRTRPRSTTPRSSPCTTPARCRATFGPLPYIVMEYVDGADAARDRQAPTGPMSQQQVHRGHRRRVPRAGLHPPATGIIHRDVKPANIMISHAGAVKVMDFGIARALGEGQNVTQTAAVIGTAQYLSPEQARGETVDARSDVYSAGLRALRTAHRRTAFHRRLPGRRGLPARPRGPELAVGGQPGGLARSWTPSCSRRWPRTRRTATRRPPRCAPTWSACAAGRPRSRPPC